MFSTQKKNKNKTKTKNVEIKVYWSSCESRFKIILTTNSCNRFIQCLVYNQLQVYQIKIFIFKIIYLMSHYHCLMSYLLLPTVIHLHAKRQ